MSRRWTSPHKIITRAISNSASYDDYCISLTRTKDYENYLIGLLVPRDYKSVFFAVKAFNIEIATIRDNTPKNSLQAGRYRFQYWRNSLQSIGKTSELQNFDNQPVLNALARHIPKYNLSSRWFERSLESRFKDLSLSVQQETVEDLEMELEYAHSSLLYLLLEAIGVADESAQFAASHLGVCTGLVTLLRALPHHSSNGWCCLPEELLLKHGLSRRTVLHGPGSAEERRTLQDATQDLAGLAWAHLVKAQQLSEACRTQSAPARAVFLSVASMTHFLRLLQSRDFDPFLAAPAALEARQQLALQLRLLYAHYFKDITVKQL
mmetsp:Transcript_2292/g.3127  ORF Transcript_2292/g.3127 Transcript_2292/m.3127 type:complete len:322 (-) Transcript_2292:23-988(-)